MALEDALFTDEQARQIRDNTVVFSDRPPGIDLPALLDGKFAEVVAEFALRPAGTAVILSGNASIVVADASLAGLRTAPVVAVLGEADGAIHVLSVVWDGALDQFTITVSANVTADRDVYWMVNGG